MTGAALAMSYEAIGWVLRDAPDVPSQCVSVLIGLAEHADKHGRGAYPSAVTLATYARKSERQVRYDLALLGDAKLIRPGDQMLVKKYPPNRRPVVYDLAVERVASKPSDCAYCGKPADTIDHVIPVSRGGTDLPGNRVPACGLCNSSKRDLTLEEWIATGRAPDMAAGVQSIAPLGGQLTAPQPGRGVKPVAPQPGVQLTAPQTAQTGSDLREHGGVQSVAPPAPDFLGCNAAQPGVQSTADKPPLNLPLVDEEVQGGSGGDGSAGRRKPRRSRRDLNKDRDDAMRLCVHLANRIEGNTGERPEIGVKWRNAARLMLDTDKRREDQVHRAIDWCQSNEFWRSNVLSMSKLREKYVTLRMQAEAEQKALANGHRAANGATAPRQSTADQRLAEIQAHKERDRLQREGIQPANVIQGSVYQ